MYSNLVLCKTNIISDSYQSVSFRGYKSLMFPLTEQDTFMSLFSLCCHLDHLSLGDDYQLWFSGLEIWLRRSTLSKLKLWLMDEPFNSPFSQPIQESPQIFSLIYGVWPALRVHRSTIDWNMFRPREKQNGCFSVYLRLKTKRNEGGPL